MKMNDKKRNTKIPKDMVKGSVHKTNGFGDLEIVEYKSSKLVHILFVATGSETVATATNIRPGVVKDKNVPSICGIGFIGYGRMTSTHRSYNTWKGMIGRCYDESVLEKYPTYRGCEVCEEWHNFQNFAEWYDSNYPDDGKAYHLDKDKKQKGNKLHSPSTCVFLSPQENSEVSNAKDCIMICPDGNLVSFHNMAKFCRDKNLDKRNLSSVYHDRMKSYKGWRLPE